MAIPPDLPPGRHPPDPVAATEPTPEPPPREGVASGLAGVMYLVNAVAWLDPPRHLPELAIGPWELVELLGRWLVAPAERWLGDPVWGELALLDGREPGTLPGCSVAAGAEYGLPAAWWEPYADLDADRYWARQAGTVRTWSSHGFLLADGPAGTVPTHGRRRPPAAAPLARLAAPAVAGLSAGSAWWLARLGPYVASRLAAELDVPQAALHAELLDRPGRLHATRTHVDVEMPLDAVSLRVRRAGLDRNPGWLPWFGRVVTFHFE